MMGIYVCAHCDNYIDNDYNPCTEYQNNLICPDCDEKIPEDQKEIKYFKSQIIPSDKGTIVYWAEQGGKAWDVRDYNIPKDAQVNDETYKQQRPPKEPC